MSAMDLSLIVIASSRRSEMASVEGMIPRAPATWPMAKLCEVGKLPESNGSWDDDLAATVVGEVVTLNGRLLDAGLLPGERSPRGA